MDHIKQIQVLENDLLTGRQTEMVKYWTMGVTDRDQLSRCMGITKRTVGSYNSQIHDRIEDELQIRPNNKLSVINILAQQGYVKLK